MTPETVFTYAAPALKFGVGARNELADDLRSYEAQHVLLVTDPHVTASGVSGQVEDSLRAAGLQVVVFDRVHVEPTDASLSEAISFARERGPFDAIIAVGGGSSIDTAKAVNLLTTNDGELMDYVNAPVGSGAAPQRPLLPLIALPTTTGTGSESTTICVLDVLSQQVKTGISHERLRPTAAVVDPELTVTQPPTVTAACGMDILCHALESYTAKSWDAFERKSASERVPYCGANPISDMWSLRAMELLAESFIPSVRHGHDLQARTTMAMSATFAGLGFGNAGVHIPHACAYPIAGRVRDFRPHGYGPDGGPADQPMVPHGMAVALTAPEAFRYTFEAAPERHLEAARILSRAFEDSTDSPAVAGREADFLPEVLIRFMRETGLPAGIGGVGFDESDIGDLVDGAMKQQRLLNTAPREVTADSLAEILSASVRLW